MSIQKLEVSETIDGNIVQGVGTLEDFLIMKQVTGDEITLYFVNKHNEVAPNRILIKGDFQQQDIQIGVVNLKRY